ncbi:hypothetical protein IJH89_00970 [Candidatus Saccharibacteria bacterium]|nr:hypothetical protein [Candidatus Saccharibacteria bacterium]
MADEKMMSFNEYMETVYGHESDSSARSDGASLRDTEREFDTENLPNDALFGLLSGALIKGRWKNIVQAISELEIRGESAVIVVSIQDAFDKDPERLRRQMPILRKTAMLLTKFEPCRGYDYLLRDYVEYLAAGYYGSPQDWARDTDHGLPAKLAEVRRERSRKLTAKEKIHRLLCDADDAWIEAYKETERKNCSTAQTE